MYLRNRKYKDKTEEIKIKQLNCMVRYSTFIEHSVWPALYSIDGINYKIIKFDNNVMK